MAGVIYSLIPEERLADVLQTLQGFTELPIQLLDGDGKLLQSVGAATGYCRLLKKQLFTGQECETMHRKAGERAKKLGAAYIFTCHANMNHIAFPLIHRGELLGSIIVGPFLLDEPDSTVVGALADRYPLPSTLLLELYDELSGVRVLTPTKANLLQKLLEHLLSPLLPSERATLLRAQEKLYQQSRINESIQMYKACDISATQKYLYEKERDLLSKARTGNIGETRALLNEILGHVLLSEGGTPEIVRVRAIELTTLLSRVAMDGGAKADSIYELNRQFLYMMNQEQDIDELCYTLQNVLESYMDAMFTQKDNGNAYIRHALRYMADNYGRRLTLPEVAAEVGLSESHFSTLFKNTVGITFREHLAQIRIEESKRLLLSTDISLTDIALSVGFPDQSYYCKVFKRVTGLTPGSYR